MYVREELTNFLIDLSDFYQIPAGRKESIISQSVDFLLQFCLDKRINFAKVKNAVFNEYTYKTFPDLAFLRDCLKRGEIVYENVKDEGSLILVRLPDGYVYSFEVHNNGRSFKEIENQLRERFKDIGEIKIKHFPKGTDYVNGKIYLPDAESGEVLIWE